jgi:hypothetical protein
MSPRVVKQNVVQKDKKNFKLKTNGKFNGMSRADENKH